MTSPERIEQSIARGILFAKIGAKTTKKNQPMDRMPFFLTMKVFGHHMTSVRIESPLTILVDITLKKLRKDKVLILPKLEECALKCCVATSPRIIESASL